MNCVSQSELKKEKKIILFLFMINKKNLNNKTN